MKRKLQNFLQQVRFLRILGLIFALLLCIKLLPACTNQPVTLSFVVAQEEVKYWQPLIEQFNQNNPDIFIKLANNSEIHPNNTDQLKDIYKPKSKGKPLDYDLVYMDIIWVPEFAENEILQDLTNEFSSDDLKKEFLVSEVDNGLYKNKLYRIPFRTDVGVLFYRKDLLKAVNEKPPKTFDDLLRIAQKVKKQSPGIQDGYLWQGRRTEALAAMFVEVLKGYGGIWIDEKKTVGLDKPEAIQAVKFLRDTIDLGISPQSVTSDDENETRNKFLAGQAIFLRNWPNVWLDANRPNSFVRGKIDIQPMPMVHAQGKENNSGGCKGGWGFGIAKNTKHKKQAVEVIKFFTSAAVQRQFTVTYGSVPTRRQLFFEPKIVAKYNHFPQLLSMIDEPNTWVPRPRIPQYAQASCILQKHLNAALSTNKGHPSPEEAMKKAAEETRHLLDTGKFECEISKDE